MRIPAACTLAIALLLPLLASAEATGDLRRLLPADIAGWKPLGEDRVFTRRDIVGYLGGGGELYLAFAFRRLLVREYEDGGGARLVAEIYDMSHSRDAFGIFSGDEDGQPAAVGTEAVYGAGLLRFWKGPFFVRIAAGRETAETRSFLIGFGLRVAAAIHESGPRPRILACLPLEHQETRSVRYFHRQVSLNASYYLADENVLQLDAGTEVALAKYRAGWGKAILLVARYRMPADAERAFLRFGRDYFSAKPVPGSRQVVEEIDHGEFAAARRVGRCLVLVFESPDRATCESLIADAEARIRKTFRVTKTAAKKSLPQPPPRFPAAAEPEHEFGTRGSESIEIRW
jgi:hypothetical protein